MIYIYRYICHPVIAGDGGQDSDEGPAGRAHDQNDAHLEGQQDHLPQPQGEHLSGSYRNKIDI